MVTIVPRVIDISHYDRCDSDWVKRISDFGIWGVIHKATESTGYSDPDMRARRRDVNAGGLLWGTYHFIRAGSMQKQVDFYLRTASPAEGDLCALDWEVPQVSADMAEEWLTLCARSLGRRPVIYSGNTAKEALGARSDSFFGSHRLWLAQYSSRPVVQRSWSRAWLWQYTGDGLGPSPHNVPGVHIAGGCDINHYPDERAVLEKEWSSDAKAPEAPQDLTGTWWVQRRLNELGCDPPLVVDGISGPLTRRAVIAFQRAMGLVVDGIIGEKTVAALDVAQGKVLGGV